MPKIDTLTEAPNARLAMQLSRIHDAQAAHFAEHGRYWQGLPTHSAVPDGETDVEADAWDRKAEGETKTWRDIGGTPPAMRFCRRIDAYNGPGGKGYVIVLCFKRGEALWERSINVGPEDWRDRPWAAHTPPPV